jgi:ubiquitin carboxyl-terminal hydrolase 8
MRDSYKNYSNKGLTGLANLGNTCYLNACLQTLSHTYEFNNLLNTIDFNILKNTSKNIDKLEILIEWKNLLDLMWSKNCTIAPNGFVKAIQNYSKKTRNCFFSNFSQNDIQEFLMFLFDAFHIGISRETNIFDVETQNNNENDYYHMMNNNFKKEYSEIIELFYGATYIEITSMETNVVLSRKFQPFFVLNLSIPNKKDINLYDCLKFHSEYEELKDDNAWLNDKTNVKENVKKQEKIWKLPNVLIIHLKRWNYKGQKNNDIIDFDLDCDFANYITNDANINVNYNYELYSVSNHHGGSGGGHYTSYVKNANNKWYHFNDTNVQEISKEIIVSNKAYCLFYRKK